MVISLSQFYDYLAEIFRDWQKNLHSFSFPTCKMYVEIPFRSISQELRRIWRWVTVFPRGDTVYFTHLYHVGLYSRINTRFQRHLIALKWLCTKTRGEYIYVRCQERKRPIFKFEYHNVCGWNFWLRQETSRDLSRTRTINFVLRRNAFRTFKGRCSLTSLKEPLNGTKKSGREYLSPQPEYITIPLSQIYQSTNINLLLTCASNGIEHLRLFQ